MRKKMRVYTATKQALDQGFEPEEVLAAVADALYAHVEDALHDPDARGLWATKGIHTLAHEALGDLLDYLGAERPASLDPLIEGWCVR